MNTQTLSTDGAIIATGNLFEKIVCFGHALHDKELRVNSANLIDFFKCFEHIDFQFRNDVHAAGRATLVSRRDDLDTYDQVFSEFWEQIIELPQHDQKKRDKGQDSTDEEKNKNNQQQSQKIDDSNAEAAEKESSESTAYCAEDVLLNRDLGQLSEAEVEQARKLIKELVDIIASQWNRRKVADKRGRNFDFRRMLRQNVLYSSEGFSELKYLSRRLKKPKLVLLCDVSGSMQSYSHFLIRFMYGLRKEIADLDVAVFSTRLTVITDLLKSKGVEKSLAQVSDYVDDWAGGTDIGGCLQEFNQYSAAKMVRSRSVVIILSDGWDRGEATLLREQIMQLKRRAHRLLWLNPLLGNEGYQPLCRGMATALPYLDYFLPAHNLKSLAKLANTLKLSW